MFTCFQKDCKRPYDTLPWESVESGSCTLGKLIAYLLSIPGEMTVKNHFLVFFDILKSINFQSLFMSRLPETILDNRDLICDGITIFSGNIS